jgi:maltodextrin utilization protein YvdJ
MIKFFTDSFRINRIYSLKNTKGTTLVFYFLLLILIISFPLNLQIIRSSGWDLYNFTAGIREQYPDWLPSQLPDDIEISASGMYYEDTTNREYLTYNNQDEDLYIVISPLGDYVPYDRTLMFEENQISYYDENGQYMFSADYSKITSVVSFYDLQFMEQAQAVNKFCGVIEDSFSGYAQFKSIILNTVINFVLNTLLIFVVSAMFLLIRFNYQKVTSFGENLRIMVSSMTIPAMISFVVGLFEFIEATSLTQVIFQFATPIIAYIAIYKGSKNKEVSIKHT